MIILFQIFALAFSLFAFLQKERKKFLIINSFAIFFMSLSFYFNGGIAGAYIEFLMLFIHLTALFVSKEIELKLKFFAPPLSLLFAFYLTDSSNPFLISFAIFFFIVGVFQRDMIYNKLFFIVGMLFLLSYSLLLHTYIISISNIISLFILSYSIYSLKYTK